MNRRSLNQLTLTQLTFLAASLAAVLGATSCHSKEVEHESAVLPVTKPVHRDVDLPKRYVSQIRSFQHIELRALERGYLEKIFVDEGQPVKRGQPMFQILSTLYQAELEKAQAEAEFARIEYQNTQALAERNIVSPNELSLAKAKLDKAKAEVALARVHKSFTEIKAPFDGIMGRLHVRLGSLVSEGELLTTLSDNSKMWVYFNVSEAEYLDFESRKDGEDNTRVRLVMANGEPFAHPGKIETIEADFNNETGTIAFRATFPNPEGLLRHGETGTVIMTKTLRNALVIPQKSTFEVLDKRYVFVIDARNVVRARQIAITEEVPHLFVVDSGLTANDKILLEGLTKVRDGEAMTARYVEPNEALAHLEVPAE